MKIETKHNDGDTVWFTHIGDTHIGTVASTTVKFTCGDMDIQYMVSFELLSNRIEMEFPEYRLYKTKQKLIEHLIS